MNIKKILETYCLGCSGGWPKVRFVKPEGDRYVHRESSKHAKGDQPIALLICSKHD
jgi:hypothetical protein